MSIEKGCVGLIVKVTGQFQGSAGSKTLLVYTQAGAMEAVGSQTFALGLFPNILTVLLVAAKNKFKFGSSGSGNGGVLFDFGSNGCDSVELLGLLIADDPKNFHAYISYSTLPFVYICSNELGANAARSRPYGIAMPVYSDFQSGQGTGGQSGPAVMDIVLDRRSGNYGLVAPASAPALPISVDEIRCVFADDETRSACLGAYNADFLDDGYGSTLLDQIRAIDARALDFQRPGAAYASVLNDIADRWHANVVSGRNRADGYHYNIGAALCVDAVRRDPRAPLSQAVLLRSLNIKSRNKAAHAEVRIAMLLDFLAALAAAPSGNHAPIPALPPEWRTRAALRTMASKLEEAQPRGTRFTLFSSLLPCYMCEGVIETTGEAGVIRAINDTPVGLWPSFPGSDRPIPIRDTVYFDIDAAIDYHHVDGVRLVGQPTPQSVFTIRPVSIRSHLPSTGVLTFVADPKITPYPIAVFDAGSTIVGYGLQNTETVIRYRLAAEVLTLFTGAEAVQVVQ